MKKPTFTVVSGTEEWEGLYVDGELVMEDHSLRVHRLLDYLRNHGYLNIEWKYVEQEWLNDRGNLPTRLEDVPDESSQSDSTAVVEEPNA